LGDIAVDFVFRNATEAGWQVAVSRQEGKNMMTPRQRTAAWIETQIMQLKSMTIATRGAVDLDMQQAHEMAASELAEYESLKRIVLEVYDEENP
jgi:uncharacterized protein GlcG (DUF336 family)